jgi:hypothetical protein
MPDYQPTRIAPFNDSMATLEIRDWSRGLATYFPAIKIEAGQFSILYNMLMEPDRSIRVRPGIDPALGDKSADTDFSGEDGDAVSFYRASDIDTDETIDDQYLLVAMQDSTATATMLRLWGHDSTAWDSHDVGFDNSTVPEFFSYTVNDKRDIFACNGVNTPQRLKISGTTMTATNMGIPATLNPTISTAVSTQAQDVFTKAGVKVYKVSFFYGDGTLYGESDLQTGTATSVTVNHTGTNAPKITVETTNFTNAPHSEIDYMKFYRAKDVEGIFRFVDSIKVDGTSTSYTWVDRVPVGEEQEMAPLDATYMPKLKFPVVGPAGRVWGVDGAYPYKVVYSRKGQPDVFDKLAYTYLPEDCTGLIEFNGSMYAFTESNCFQLLNSDPNTYDFQKVTDVGCIEHRTIKDVENGIIWFNGHNVYWANFNFRSVEEGAFPIPIGDPIKDKFEQISRLNLQKTRAAFVNNRYFLSFCSAYDSQNVQTLAYDVVLGTPMIRTGKYGGWSEIDTHFQDAMEYRKKLNTLDATRGYVYEHGNLDGVDYTNYTSYSTSTGGVDIPFEMASGQMLLGHDVNEKYVKAISLVADASDISVNVNVEMNDGEFEKNKVITLSTDSLSRYTNPMIYNNTNEPYYLSGTESLYAVESDGVNAWYYTTGAHGFGETPAIKIENCTLPAFDDATPTCTEPFVDCDFGTQLNTGVTSYINDYSGTAVSAINAGTAYSAEANILGTTTVPNTAPLAFWKMNEESGFTVADTMGSYDLSTTGSNLSSMVSGGRASSVTNLENRLYFVGTSTRWLTMSDTDNFSFGNGTTDSKFSFMGWFESTYLNAQRDLLNKEDEYMMGWNNQKELWFKLIDKSREGEGDNEIIRYSIPLDEFTIHHFAVTYDGSGTLAGLNFYINGVLANGTSGTPSVDGANYTAMENLSNDFYIGKGFPSPAVCYLHQLRVYNYNLTESPVWGSTVIPNHYNSGDGTEATTLDFPIVEGCSWTDGATLGRALNFDGSANSYVDFDSVSGFDVGTDDFTVSLWIYGETITTGTPLIASKWDNPAGWKIALNAGTSEASKKSVGWTAEELSVG